MEKKELLSVNIVDGISLWEAGQIFSARMGTKVVVDHKLLIDTINSFRSKSGMSVAKENILMIGIDERYDTQRKFINVMEECGYEVVACHYKDLQITSSKTELHKASLASRIAYILGSFLCIDDTIPVHVVVVTSDYHLSAPLVDLSKKVSDKSKVACCYFQSIMDYRWQVSGVLNSARSSLLFFDLDTELTSLCGLSNYAESESTGLTQLDIPTFKR